MVANAVIRLLILIAFQLKDLLSHFEWGLFFLSAPVMRNFSDPRNICNDENNISE
jgi:hypothetical protein